MSQVIQINFSKKKGLTVRCPASSKKLEVKACIKCPHFVSASIGQIICNRFTVIKGVL
jgi:hypothetical protein